MKTKLIMESWRRFLKEQTEEQGMKRIFVLVGPPSVGKSTWIRKTFGDVKPYIINRDDIVSKVAKEAGLTYDDLFELPDQENDKIGDVHDVYGKVIKSPHKYAKVVYDKIQNLNNQVRSLFQQRVEGAVPSGKDIVVDMTNMYVGSRKGALSAIEKAQEGEYKKIAVVFSFEGAEDTIRRMAALRAKRAKEAGESKTIPDHVMTKMMKQFQKVEPSEGFDEIISVDNREELEKELQRITAEEP